MSEAWVIALVTMIVAVILAWATTKATLSESKRIEQNERHNRELLEAAWRGDITAKVDAMWKVLFRTATFDGLLAGILQTKSPIRVNLEAFKSHPDLERKMRDFYETEGRNLQDLELFIELEKRFSDEFAQFESQHRLRAVASVAAACYLLRPEMKIFNHKHFEGIPPWEDKPDRERKTGGSNET